MLSHITSLEDEAKVSLGVPFLLGLYHELGGPTYIQPECVHDLAGEAGRGAGGGRAAARPAGASARWHTADTAR